MNVIIDYGVGNLSSLISACEAIGFKVEVSGDPALILAADALILPGVGAFGAAMKELEKRGLISLIKEKAQNGTPMLGICLGMQLFFDYSEENGFYEGLGLIKGSVKRIPETVKVPHMGWNQLDSGEYVYYVHSYYVETEPEFVAAYSDYGVKVPGIVQQGRLLGMQFHPEKSSSAGLGLLNKFKEMVERRCQDAVISSD